MAAPESSSSARSGGGGATADTYIGSLISLTSKSEIRYEGILYNINTDESSIGLQNVRSFGTEGRKKDGPQVPPSDKIYEYILFRGSDIKDLQVKSSPPAQVTQPINSDPAIIQSHYPRPTTSSIGLPTHVTSSLTDMGPQSSQMGHLGSTYQSSLPLYQPGGNLNTWAPGPGTGPGVGQGPGPTVPPLPPPPQMYWQGFYGGPNGVPQLHQQSMLRPPGGLLMPPLQQMQFTNYNLPPLPPLPLGPAPPQPPSNLPEYPSLSAPPPPPPSNLPEYPSLSTPPPPPPSSENKNPILSANTNTFNVTPLPSISFMSSTTDIKPSSSSSILPGNTSLSNQTTTISQTIPSLITPGQLLQSGPPSVGPTQVITTTQKDVEVVVQVSSPKPSPKSSPEPPPPPPVAQPPILPLPQTTQTTRTPQRSNGPSYQPRQNYRGRGGRGPMMSRPGRGPPVQTFTEEFDFIAMNEKFKKEEVWGSLGKSNKSNNSDEDDPDLEDDTELQKPVYNKDDFFDNLSSNTVGNDSNHGRMRFSEQLKLDTETFGEFQRYNRGGRGGRGPGRGGRSRGGSYYGRGGGNGYGGYRGGGRGRGGVSNYSS